MGEAVMYHYFAMVYKIGNADSTIRVFSCGVPPETMMENLRQPGITERIAGQLSIPDYDPNSYDFVVIALTEGITEVEL